MSSFKSSNRLGYQFLSSNQKKVYDAVFNALKNFDLDAAIPKLSLEEIADAIKIFSGDYPEFINLDHSHIETETGLFGSRLKIKYLFNKSDFRQKESLLYNKVRNIISDEHIEQETDDYRKLMKIYSYMYRHIKYDHEDKESSFIKNPKAHNAYGAIIENLAVCEGNALAFNLLAKESGISCMYISGDMEGEPHAWVIVKINGSFFHIDPTPVEFNFERPEETDFSFFALSDKDIMYNHNWDKNFYPACPESDFMCYKIFETYVNNIGQLKYLIKECSESGQRTVFVKLSDKFPDIEEDKLINAVQNVLLENQNEVYLQYSFNKNLKTCVFKW